MLRKLKSFIDGAILFIKNVFLFRKELRNFQPWDIGHYNISILARSLEISGNYILKHGHLVDSVKMGRRAIYMAHLLRRAYIIDVGYTDKTKQMLLKELQMDLENHRCVFTYGRLGKELYDGLSKANTKRLKKESDSRVEHALTYVKKYMGNIWD